MSTNTKWVEDNQRYLQANIDDVKHMLQKYIGGIEGIKKEFDHVSIPEWMHDEPPALEVIVQLFKLSKFEKNILVLCAGIEIDRDLAHLCQKSQKNSNPYPTFELILAVLPDARWSALSPGSTLRHFMLIDMYESTSLPLTLTPLRIDERILQYLAGVKHLDGRLAGIAKPNWINAPIANSQRSLVERIMEIFANSAKLPIIQLTGTNENSKQLIARNICELLNLDLWKISSESLPTKTDELEFLSRLWAREAALLTSGLYIYHDGSDISSERYMKKFLENAPGPIFVSSAEPLSFDERPAFPFQVDKPTKKEQNLIWNSLLETKCSEQDISLVISQFDFDSVAIQEIVSIFTSPTISSGVKNTLWESCKMYTRPRLQGLAQMMSTKVTMDDLILAAEKKELLRDIVINVKQRAKVYHEWGFDKTDRGLGITALFFGQSGTGKTMAAQAIANELGLDLYRVDLSLIVSKYIGDTEKNLRQVFDAADGGAILFFDEADALFGKRAQVKDSHDRYANIEVSYLLQKMEEYQGLAILATNMKDSLDPAFMRRISFSVNFSFPNEKERQQIWENIFPKKIPIVKEPMIDGKKNPDYVDFKKLAKLNITGGEIRNIALNSSFLAANEKVPVSMSLIAKAAKIEYVKIGQTFSSELVGMV